MQSNHWHHIWGWCEGVASLFGWFSVLIVCHHHKIYLHTHSLYSTHAHFSLFFVFVVRLHARQNITYRNNLLHLIRNKKNFFHWNFCVRHSSFGLLVLCEKCQRIVNGRKLYSYYAFSLSLSLHLLVCVYTCEWVNECAEMWEFIAIQSTMHHHYSCT